MGLLELLIRVASFVFGSREKAPVAPEIHIDSVPEYGWEVVHTREFQLFPRRRVADSGSVEYEGVRVASSIKELPLKTWVLVRRGEEDHVLAWSPCDGEQIMLPCKLLGEPEPGLLLAAGSSHLVASTCLLVDYDDRVVYVGEDSQVYSSLTDSWEPLPADYDREGTIDAEQLGKTYMMQLQFKYNPKLKVRKSIPIPVKRLIHLHWYKGDLYAMGGVYDEFVFKLFKWQGDERGWLQTDSYPMFCHGVQRPGGDRFCISAGDRYFCITQVHEEEALMNGRFMVVYDLQEAKWHYRTIHHDGFYGFPTALVGLRGECGNVLDSVFRAVWTQNPDLLFPPS